MKIRLLFASILFSVQGISQVNTAQKIAFANFLNERTEQVEIFDDDGMSDYRSMLKIDGVGLKFDLFQCDESSETPVLRTYELSFDLFLEEKNMSQSEDNFTSILLAEFEHPISFEKVAEKVMLSFKLEADKFVLSGVKNLKTDQAWVQKNEFWISARLFKSLSEAMKFRNFLECNLKGDNIYGG